MKGFFDDKIKVKSAIDRTVLAAALERLFTGKSLEEIVHYVTNEFEATIDYFDLSSGKNACQTTSLLFNPHRLLIETKKKQTSFYRFMNEDPRSFFSGFARVLLMRRKEGATIDGMFKSILSLGNFNNTQIALEFPPIVARNTCIQFGINADDKVLDPCAGWGGRMIGISTVSNSYTCFEPSTKTYNGLLKLAEFIKKMNPEFKADVNKLPFEDAKLKKESFDFAITSPPYYDTEYYSDEKTNSLNCYKTFDDWVNGFYLPLIRNTMRALKPGKIFVLNIGSRIYPLNEILIDNFGKEFGISKVSFLVGKGPGLGKKGEGEVLYGIRKDK